MKEEIQMLNDMMTPAVQTAIAEYTTWHFVSAVGWMLSGVVAITAAILIWRWMKKTNEVEGFPLVVAVVLLAYGFLTFPVNLADVVSPKAYAIHQLIKDVRAGH